jgi:hypothetical protein
MLMEEFNYSERAACKLLEVDRSSYLRQRSRADAPAVRHRKG